MARLARRDFIKEYGENTIRKMDWNERIEKENPFIERHGIDRLEVPKD